MAIPTAGLRIRPTIGIDLGTTNSVISVLDDTGSILLTGHDEQGRVTLPSVIGWDAEKKQLVAGREALAADPHTLPLSSVKRYMGLDRRFPVGPKTLSPQGASAVLLNTLRGWLARALAPVSAEATRLIDRAIITMPAYFNHNQIEATRQAGEYAGYEVVELLHEPTAAAIYYSWLHNHGDATYLVYDLGGGTFDVSVIRRRLGDHEVLAVSGDPFLGGDDFDRLLASHLLDVGVWKWNDEPFDPHTYFDPTRPEGAAPFARLVRLAEQIKVELGSRQAIDHYAPRVLIGEDGRQLSLEASVSRQALEQLIRPRIERTIACCHEALGRARERAGIQLRDIDHVVLVGGSSRLPLVRQVVQAAFANPDLPEHARSPELLLHEPDLCVAYGAALRAAGHGTRYLFQVETPGEGKPADLELHLTSPRCTSETSYTAAGVVRGSLVSEGASVRIRSLQTGLIEEAFLDEAGGFSHPVELEPESDHRFEWTVCDADGQPSAQVLTTVRHQTGGRDLGQGVLPTQIITRPLGIEVLTRTRHRVKQILAPLGATLPNTFRCTCRTSDQTGRIVLPIWEDTRIVQQLVIEDLDRSLPVGSAVEVEFDIDVKHTIQVRVRVRGGTARGDRTESATIEPPPPPPRPSRAEIDEALETFNEHVAHLTGKLRSRLRTRVKEVERDLLEALSYDDEPRAIQRMTELRELVARAEQARSQMLDPPWERFATLVRQCLDLASEVANHMGTERDELFEHVQAQERYAEEAREDHNQPLYRECFDNLQRYAGYLQQLLRDSLPRPTVRPTQTPEEEAKAEMERFRDRLSTVWKLARTRKRADLEARMAEIAKQGSSITSKLKNDPIAAIRESRRLLVEIEKVHDQMEQPGRSDGQDHGGLLEGSL